MWSIKGRPNAIAHISGGRVAPELRGAVRLYQTNHGVLVCADICCLPKTPTGVFEFHIHTGEQCTGENFADTLGHYNPADVPHPEHAGDMPPLFSCGGRAYLCFLTDRFALCQVIGKTVVIHDRRDDFTTQPAGNSGEKIACGVIERA